MNRPHCPNCSKPIPYQTDCIYAPRIKGSMWPVEDWTYAGNMIVTAKRYIDVPMDDGKMERRLWSVHVWDGERCAPRHRHFCSINCGAEYGRRAYESTSRRATLRSVS